MNVNDLVPFINPYTNRMEIMPVEMISVYVPFASHLNMEQAARVTAIRDDEAAANLLLSIVSVLHPETNVFDMILDGTGHDRLSIEPPSLR